MLRKFIISVICCLSILALCAVPSFAATMSDREMAIEQISLCWQTSTNNKNVVSFDSLTSLCADLNRGGYPCEIRFVSALNGYAILGTGYVHNTLESGRVYPLQGKYYSNIEGSIFYSPYQSDSLLSSISTYLSAISSKVSTISDTLSSFQSNVQKALVQIYSKLSGISDSVSTGVSHLNSINSFLSSDLITFFETMDSSVSGISSSLSLISSKMNSLVDTFTTENGKNSLFFPITRRLDTIISSLGSTDVNTGSLRYWRIDDDSIGSLNYSDVGYDALSSLMETVTASYLDYQVVSGNSLYYLDSVDSLSIVRRQVGSKLGYFIQCVGKYRQSVNGVNQFFDGVFYLTEKNGTIFYSSDESSSLRYLKYIDSSAFSMNEFVRTIDTTLTDNLPIISKSLDSFQTYVRNAFDLNSRQLTSITNILSSISSSVSESKSSLDGFSNNFSSYSSATQNYLFTRVNSLSNDIGEIRSMLLDLDDSYPSLLNSFKSSLLSIDSKLNNFSGSSPSDLSNIESALSTIIDKMDNLPASVDNIVVNITEDNSAYNIFYVQDENGDKKSVTSVAGDSMSASGKLLQFLYKLIIGAAISDVDNSISGLNDFFFDNAPSGLGEGVTVWD